MHAQEIMPMLRKALKANGLRHTPRYVAAGDGGVDDEIAFDLAGADTGIRLQIGYGYAGLNEEEYKDGKLCAIAHLAYWDLPRADRVVNETVKIISRRVS